MRVALVREFGGIDSLDLAELPDPAPAAGQALVRIHGAGADPWDVGSLSGAFPGVSLPFVPGQEVAGVVEAAGDGGRAISIVLSDPPAELERGITGQSFAANPDRPRLEELARLVDAGELRPQVEAVLPLEQAREALARVACGHTRGKIVLEVAH